MVPKAQNIEITSSWYIISLCWRGFRYNWDCLQSCFWMLDNVCHRWPQSCVVVLSTGNLFWVHHVQLNDARTIFAHRLQTSGLLHHHKIIVKGYEGQSSSVLGSWIVIKGKVHFLREVEPRLVLTTIPKWWREVTILKASCITSFKPRYSRSFDAGQHFYYLW